MNIRQTIDFVIEDGRTCVVDRALITHLLPASNGVLVFVAGGATITAQCDMPTAIERVFGIDVVGGHARYMRDRLSRGG